MSGVQRGYACECSDAIMCYLHSHGLQVGRLEQDSRKLLSSEEQVAKEQMRLWDERLQERRDTDKRL